MSTHQDFTIPSIGFNSNGELNVQAAAASSKHDFDFYIGKWNVHNRKLQTRLQHASDWIEFEAKEEMHTILDGSGNIDCFRTAIYNKPFEGMTLRLFNPHTKLWSIYWADTNKGKLDPPVVGSFENGVGHFWGRDEHEKIPVLVVFRWDARNKENPVWSQAFSTDNGLSWEWNWHMYFTKQNQ
jgi:hypothetical protein